MQIAVGLRWPGLSIQCWFSAISLFYTNPRVAKPFMRNRMRELRSYGSVGGLGAVYRRSQAYPEPAETLADMEGYS